MNEKMKKRIKKNLTTKKIYCEHNKDKPCEECMKKIYGEVSEISGEVSEISGEVSEISDRVSEISGEVSEISGRVSGIYGRVSEILEVLKKEK